jgi:hypothetical protein
MKRKIKMTAVKMMITMLMFPFKAHCNFTVTYSYVTVINSGTRRGTAKRGSVLRGPGEERKM